MNEEEQAKENFATWLGNKPPRELIAATIMAGIIDRELDIAAKKDPNEATGTTMRKLIDTATGWADELIRYSKEHPPR